VLPDVEDVVVSKQYIGGSLFKSQNGTIWTPSQYEDLCFKLRKASFVSSGTATFYNTPIRAGNLNTQKLPDNPIRTLPRKLKINVSGNDCTDANLGIGQKVSQADATNNTVPDDASITGIVEGQGSSVTGVTKITDGSGYDNRKLIIFSDLIQNSENLSIFNSCKKGKCITWDSVKDAPKIKALMPAFSSDNKPEVLVYYLQCKYNKNLNNGMRDFWTGYFTDAGMKVTFDTETACLEPKKNT